MQTPCILFLKDRLGTEIINTKKRKNPTHHFATLLDEGLVSQREGWLMLKQFLTPVFPSARLRETIGQLLFRKSNRRQLLRAFLLRRCFVFPNVLDTCNLPRHKRFQDVLTFKVDDLES